MRRVVVTGMGGVCGLGSELAGDRGWAARAAQYDPPDA